MTDDGVPCEWEGCEKVLPTERGMKIHHKTVHGESLADIKPDDGVPCEWDGCEKVLPTESGMKTHHAQVHGESIAGISVECEWCGETLRRRRSYVEKFEHIFCSGGDCYGSWRSENRSEENHPKWGGGTIEVECAWCEEPKEVPPVRAEQYNVHFCTAEDGGSHSQCRLNYMSQSMAGEGNYNWRGGINPFNYGPGWNEEKREQVRKRDGRECQNCGLSEVEHIEQYGRKHHVHHIQKARSFDDPEKRNHPSNLITLCHSKECHYLWEQMSPLRPQIVTEAVSEAAE